MISLGLVPLQVGANLVDLLLNVIFLGIVNFLANVLLAILEPFLFFPNPRAIPGLEELWWSTLPVFFFVWLVGALGVFTSMSIFPYNENLDPWRFTLRSLIAISALFISRPAIALIVEVVNTLGQYIYPASFNLQFSLGSYLEILSSMAGGGLVAVVLGGLFSATSALPLIIVLGILSIRALLIYLVYATFPIWIAAWIFDAGPLKYLNTAASLIFRSFGLLLGIGILTAAILATGGALAAFDPSASAATAVSQSSPTPGQLSLFPANAPPASASQPPFAFIIQTIGFFGAIWGAFGILSSALGLLTSVGGGAAARSSGRFQRKMPGGGADTSTDRGAPIAGAGRGGGSAGVSTVAPGNHGAGPGESGFGTPDVTPQRSISSQVAGAASTIQNASLRGSLSSLPPQSGISFRDRAAGYMGSARSGLHKTVRAVDTFGRASNQALSGDSMVGTMQTATQYVRENPLVGDTPTAAEMLEKKNASFLYNGDFIGGEPNGPGMYDGDGNPIAFHPNTAAGWAYMNSEGSEVLRGFNGEAYRGFRPGSQDPLVIANLSRGGSSIAQSTVLTSQARYRLGEDGGLKTETPYAHYDPDSGLLFATEKQGRSLTEIQQSPEMDDADIDRQSYIDEVAASMMIGHERGARGDVLFDKNGTAFTPEVNQTTINSFSADKREQLLDDATKNGLATREEITARISEAQSELRESYRDETGSDPVDAMALRATRATSQKLYDESYGAVADTNGEIRRRRKALGDNMRMRDVKSEYEERHADRL